MENLQNILRSIAAPAVAVSSTGVVATSVCISDEKLFELCKRYGGNVLFWRRKFLGLLPEVAKRRLYEKKGFSSIFEFAKKMAGVSEEQVRIVLNLERRLEDKKILHGLLVEGKVSVNKLAKIVSIATKENENFWAEQVRMLPKNALETLARDQKNSNVNVVKIGDQNGLFEPKIEAKSLPGQTVGHFVLDDDIQAELNELHKKGIDVNDLLRKLLEKRKQEIEKEKEEIAQEMEIRNANDNLTNNLEFAERAAKRLSESLSEAIGDDVIIESLGPKNDDVVGSKNPSRHVPRKIKKIIKKEFGTKCAVPTCNKPVQHLHHTLPFALSQNHDPRYLMPLCKEHHVIAHSVDQKFREVRMSVT